MYAVIKTGGKQYRVSPGDMLKVESIEAQIGDTFNFEEVMMIANGEDITVGAPTIASAKVAALVVAHGRAKKVEIIKFRRRKHHQKRTGHRQNYTQVQIQNINGEGAPERVATPKTADAVTDSEAAPKKEAKTEKPAKTEATEAPKAEAEKKPAATATSKEASSSDDLSKIEGIGPKAANALVEGGIASFADLAKSSVEDIEKILEEAEGRFSSLKPATWPKQAALAADGNWDELKVLQDNIDGGIEKS